MTDSKPLRRRIDKVTSADYLTDVESKPVSELRAMRDECGQEEARLSYQRRLLHGQLDIAKAELERRDTGETASVVATLGRILTDKQSAGPTRSVGNAPVYSPPADGDHRRRDDHVLDHMALGRLPDFDDEELVAIAARVAEEEQAVSTLRRKVLDHLDRLQHLMVQRYRDGAASVDDIVPRATS